MTRSRAASLLANRLLVMKFVQGIPIPGVAGGISDALCLEQVQRYAGLNYPAPLSSGPPDRAPVFHVEQGPAPAKTGAGKISG